MSDHWRLVLSNGVVVDVEVERRRGCFNAICVASPHHLQWATSEAEAVALLASRVTGIAPAMLAVVHVAEIVAPGLMTRDEWIRHETESLRCVYAADADVPGGLSLDEVRDRCIAIVEARVSEIAEALALPPGRRPDDHVYRARQREALDELRMVRDRMRGVK